MDRRAFWQRFTDLDADRRPGALDVAAHRLRPGDLDVPFCKERTPLGLAAAQNDSVVAARLLQLGANPDGTDMAGRTPLHVAISRGHTSLAELLLDRGAAPHAPDASLRTPLMYALFHGDAVIAKRLIDAGARQTDVDVDGRTVHDYLAQRRKGKDHAALAKLLEKKHRRRKLAPYPAVLTVPEFRHFRTYQGYLSEPMGSLARATIAAFMVGAGGYGNFLPLELLIMGDLPGFPFSIGPLDLAVLGSGPGLAMFAAICVWAFFARARRDLGQGGRRQAPQPGAASVANIADLAAGARDICHLLRHGSVALLESAGPTVAAPMAAGVALLRLAHGICLALGAALFAGACVLLGSVYVAMYISVRYDPSRFPDLSSLDVIAATAAIAVIVAAGLLGLGVIARCVSLREVRLRQRQRDATAGRFLAGAEGAEPRIPKFALYLRSFHYDRALHLNGSDFEATLVYSIGRSLEVVALGRPGDLGAARLSTTDAAWRADFERLSAGAAGIFLIPGASDGTLWEIEALSAQRSFARTVFVMPPEARIAGASMSEIWAALLCHPRLSRFELPPYRAKGAVFTLRDDGTLRSWGPIGIETLPLPMLIGLGGPDAVSSPLRDRNDELCEEIDGEGGALELDAAGADASSGDCGDGGGGE